MADVSGGATSTGISLGSAIAVSVSWILYHCKRSTDPVFQSECGSGKLTARERIANTARLMENTVTCA
jgi:hypothetical protein